MATIMAIASPHSRTTNTPPAEIVSIKQMSEHELNDEKHRENCRALTDISETR